MSRLKSIGASAAGSEEPAKPIAAATNPTIQVMPSPNVRRAAPEPEGAGSSAAIAEESGRVIMAPERVDALTGRPHAAPLQSLRSRQTLAP